VIVYLGAAVLGYAAAEMMLSDKAIGPLVEGYELVIKVVLTIAVVLIGYWKKTK